MVNAIKVAEWFLHKKSFNHKQLQKLCYYAQAWHLALLNRSLFNENIQAWVHGPVIPSVYHNYVRHGWEKIKKLPGESPEFPSDTLDVLKAVYVTYSKLDGGQLEILTHSELPWQEARGNLKPYEPSQNVISVETMRTYYAEKYRQAQGE